MKTNQSIQTEIRKLEKISFRQLFCFGGLIPALISYPFFYFLNPIAQENVTTIPLVIMTFLAVTCMWLTLSTFSAVVLTDYVRYSPRVYSKIYDKICIFLATNKIVKEILDLFVISAENKLNPQWNTQHNEIIQTKERVDGIDNQLKELKDATERYEPHLARQNRYEYDLDNRVKKIEGILQNTSLIPQKQIIDILDDVSFKAIHKQKELDEFQTRLDDFV